MAATQASAEQQQQQQQGEEKQLTTEQEIVGAYNEKRNAISNVMSRISEFEGEIHDHVLVLEALKPLPRDRRAHRLVGGALIEKTVGEVQPEIEEHLANVNKGLTELNKMLKAKEADLENFMIKYKITRQGGGDSSKDVIAKQAPSTPGVLA